MVDHHFVSSISVGKFGSPQSAVNTHKGAKRVLQKDETDFKITADDHVDMGKKHTQFR